MGPDLRRRAPDVCSGAPSVHDDRLASKPTQLRPCTCAAPVVIEPETAARVVLRVFGSWSDVR